MSIKEYANETQRKWWELSDGYKNKKKASASRSWSSYWMDDDSYDYFYDDKKATTSQFSFGTGTYTKSGAATVDIENAHRLASVRRAVSNFVHILTGNEKIVVKFSSGTDSYTTGETVIISAESDPAKFDVLVGTALHEAAHCVFSKNLLKYMTSFSYQSRRDDIISEFPDTTLDSYQLANLYHNIINVIEDRRIDMEVYSRCPGYRPYYDSMYSHYFNKKKIATSLVYDKQLRDKTINAYMFRLINITNPATIHTLDALPNFRKIYEMIDVSNILRLSSKDGTVNIDDIFELVESVFRFIVSEINEAANANNANNADGDGDGAADGDGVASASEDSDSELNNYDIGSAAEAVGKEFGQNKLRETKLDTDSMIHKQTDIVNNNFNKGKKKIRVGTERAIKALEKSGTELGSINIENTNMSFVRIQSVKDSTLNILPYEIFNANAFKDAIASEFYNDGIRLGRIIVDKIKIRHDENSTKFTRRNIGKLDRRLVHSLGMDNQNVFFNTVTESYKNSVIYLTIDASSSMSGYYGTSKWKKAATLATGLAYAATKINNFNIVVNLRYGLNNIWSITIYDSRVNNMNHFAKWIHIFRPSGATPESLAYELDYKYISGLNTNNNNAYFITITDGEPAYGTYNGQVAITHARKWINNIKQSGYNVLAYFIGEDRGYYNDNTQHQQVFTRCYGANGTTVQVNSMHRIAQTVSNLLVNEE